jgi:hypothetical protein
MRPTSIELQKLPRSIIVSPSLSIPVFNLLAGDDYKDESEHVPQRLKTGIDKDGDLLEDSDDEQNLRLLF